MLNFTSDDYGCFNFVKNVIGAAQDHGIDIPSTTMDVCSSKDDLDLVTIQYQGPDALDEVSQDSVLYTYLAPHSSRIL